MQRNLGWNTFGRTEQGAEEDYNKLIKRLEQEEKAKISAKPQPKPNQKSKPKTPAKKPNIQGITKSDYIQIPNQNYIN